MMNLLLQTELYSHEFVAIKGREHMNCVKIKKNLPTEITNKMNIRDEMSS